MGKNLKKDLTAKTKKMSKVFSSAQRPLIFDTSAFISLENINLLSEVLKLFNTITTDTVIKELEEFSKHEDKYGKIARKVLKLKDKFIIESTIINEKKEFLEETDNELFNLALKKEMPLVTDDHKINHHTKDAITVFFSTFFLIAFVEAEIITRSEALTKLEALRDIRNWQNNIIYLTTKRELNDL